MQAILKKLTSLFALGFSNFVQIYLCDVATPHGSLLETPEYWEEQSKSFDGYWKQRAIEAEKINAKAAVVDPYEVTTNISSSVQQLNKNLAAAFKCSILIASEDKSGTRRLLGEGRLLKGKSKGPCQAFNPIDKCWRCDSNWAANRQRLVDCAMGFGRTTTGGKGGRIYVVTDSSDNDLMNPKPGTLRHAVIQTEPLWIIFATSMVIRLSEELIVTSHKTIDGRGANVHIAHGAGFTLQFIENVIIHGIHIHDIHAGNGGTIASSVNHTGKRTRSDGDGINIFGSSRIWIDHCSMRSCQDGLIDVVSGSTAITISNNHFTHHNEVMLFGASGQDTRDQNMQITVAFNHFGKRLTQRMPRCRWGFIHVVNNDYTQWEMYAIGGSDKPTIISEGNRFVALNNPNAKQVTKREYAYESEWKNWQWRSINDIFLSGAYFIQSGPEVIRVKSVSQNDLISAHHGTWVNKLTLYSGALKCIIGRPC
ncbi:hypothetical protein L6164_020746 [Bauhinia variegata]|uniref:Uncharacterized protein n=1 Tax=Bauhinia variegata TaxID=167791 RepID=A0ACB9MY33_BAUVA|nr:hypothetical protein L6164_020746 [Bauhinia variegata]